MLWEGWAMETSGAGAWELRSRRHQGLRYCVNILCKTGEGGWWPGCLEFISGAALITHRSVSSLCIAAASWAASPVRQTVVKTLPPNSPSPPPRVAAWVACFGDLACGLAGSGDGVCHGRAAPLCRDFRRGKKGLLAVRSPVGGSDRIGVSLCAK